jgi:antitoxin MazE
MRTRVQKWGHSLAVRIPKAFAAEAGLEEHTAVDLSVVDGRVRIDPVPETRFTLDQLLSGVTDENVHSEFETGSAIGREAW